MEPCSLVLKPNIEISWLVFTQFTENSVWFIVIVDRISHKVGLAISLKPLKSSNANNWTFLW